MKKNKIILYSIVIFLVGLIIIGGSYAFWSWTSSTNKNIVFNTAQNLKNYIVYDEGESSFTGELNVSNNYLTGSIHSTISIYKTQAAANVNLVATIHMDINQIGENMKKSTALKWVVTEGKSTNPGTVLARGNFIGTNNGDTLTLVPDIPVTTTEKFYTIWIWLDSSENPSDDLSGETLDTNVWTEVNQLEGSENRYEITRISANYQTISATVVNSKYKITNYKITTVEEEPTSWENIASADQANVYNLNTSQGVNGSGTYYVWFKDANNVIIHGSVQVSAVDTSAPSCEWGSFNPTQIKNGVTSQITLTCTDSQSGISVHNLKTTDITVSNNKVNVTGIAKTSVTGGYQYTITVTGTNNDGTSTLTLDNNLIRNGVGLGNASVTSSAITVLNDSLVTINAGAGVSSITGTGLTYDNTSHSATGNFTIGSTIDLSALTVTYKTGYSGANYTKTSGEGTLSGSTFTVGTGAGTLTINATTLATPTCSISGGVTKVYNHEAITLTGSNTTNYDSGVTLAYQFGYTTSSAGTLGGFANSNVSGHVDQYSISKTAFRTTRYYGTKITATGDGGITSSCTMTGSYATVGLVNARIDFNATTNGGSRIGAASLYVAYATANVYTGRMNTSSGTVPIATKTGYTFDGWYTAASGGTKVLNADRTIVASASDWTNASGQWILTNPSNVANTHRLYAQFIPETYTITLDNQSATTAGTNAIYEKYNTNICLDNNCATVMSTTENPITVPTKDGYTFQGYYDGSTQMIDANGHITTAFTTIKYFANQTLTANWTANTYTAKFLSGNLMDIGDLTAYSSTLIKNSSIDYDLTTTTTNGGAYLPTHLLEDGKTYVLSFKVEKTDGTFINIGGHSAAASQISFKIDNTNISTAYHSYSTNMSDKNDNQIHTVYFEFTYLPNETTSTDKKIYIQPNRSVAESISVEITDLSLYEVIENRTVTYDANYGTLPEVSRTGYTIGGWSTAPSGGNTVTATTNVVTAEDHAIYAIWNPKTYTVTFDPNGGSVSPTTKTVTYTSPYGSLPTPTKTGGTFLGWYSNKDRNLTLAASSTNNYNLVKYMPVVPGTTYTVKIGNAAVTSGSATQFSVWIYDSTDKYGENLTNVNFGSNISFTITCPASMDGTHDLNLLIYSGVYQHTAGIGTSFTDITVSTDNGNDYDSNSTVLTPGDHTLYAHWQSGDVLPPTITLATNSNSTYSKTKSVTVKLKDIGSGLASGASVKYGWSTSTSTAPSSYTTASLSYTAGTTSDVTFTASGSGFNGSYYLWVVPTTLKDVAGNSNTTTVKSTGTFRFDNTAPTATGVNASKNGTSITTSINGPNDPLSGITTYYFKLITDTTCTDGGYSSSSSNTYSFDNISATGTYYVCAKMKDAASNYSSAYRSSAITYTSTTATISNISVYENNGPNNSTNCQYGYTYVANSTNGDNYSFLGYNGTYSYVPIVTVALGSGNTAKALEVTIKGTNSSTCTTTSDTFYADVIDSITYDRINSTQSSRQIATYAKALDNSTNTYTGLCSNNQSYSISSKVSFHFNSSRTAQFVVPVTSSASTLYLVIWGHTSCSYTQGGQQFYFNSNDTYGYVKVNYWK